MSISGRLPFTSLVPFLLAVGMAVGHPTPPRVYSATLGFATTEQASPWSIDAYIVLWGNQALVEYAGFSPTKQRFFAPVAYEIAKLRRAALKRLIQDNPRQSLLLSLSPGRRQGLPKFVLDLLEARLHTVGHLVQALIEAPPGEPQANEPSVPLLPATVWTVQFSSTTRRAFLYGARLKHQTKFDTPVHGIALDDVMAIDESPLYQYDDFETALLGFQPGQIVATAGDRPIVLPDYAAFERLKRELLKLILAFGPRPAINVYAWTTGSKQLLVIKADFADRPGALYTDAEITAALAATSAFYQDNSQGATSLVPTIGSLVFRLPSASAAYAAMGLRWGPVAIRDAALAEARAHDLATGGSGEYNPDAYDRVLIVTPQVFERPVAVGDYGGKSVVVTGTRVVLEALAHEFGHTYGFIHSAFWSVVPYGADPIGLGTAQEYGDAWDMMGAPGLDNTSEDPRRRHFNAFFKTLAGWLPSAAIVDGSAGGVFRLRRHDAADADGVRAIRIVADDAKTYWIGMRRQFPWNPSMSQGVEVRRVLNDPDLSYGPVQLLDMDSVTPGVFGLEVLHSLVRFQTFTDTPAGVSVRIANVFSDEMGDYADVVVTRF